MTTTTATTTTLWTITSSAGVDMGDYAAETADLAIEAMHLDAGYASSADAAEALGTTVEALRAELTVIPADRDGDDDGDDGDDGDDDEEDEDQYRAAYWLADDGQAELVLTGLEHAGLDDDSLLEEARAELARAGGSLDGGRLVVGQWCVR